MKDSSRPMQAVPVLIGVMAAMLSGQILKGYPLGFVTRVLITLVVAVVFWYVARFFSNQGKDEEKE